MAEGVSAGKAELLLSNSLFRSLAQFLDILSPGDSRLTSPQKDQGSEEECELSSADVSDGHGSHQTPPKCFSFADWAEICVVPVYPRVAGSCQAKVPHSVQHRLLETGDAVELTEIILPNVG